MVRVRSRAGQSQLVFKDGGTNKISICSRVPAEWCLEHVCTSPGPFGGEASLALLAVDPRRTHRHTVRFSVASFRPLDFKSRLADNVQRVSETFFLRISVNVLQQLTYSQWFFPSTSVSCHFPPCPLQAWSLLARQEPTSCIQVITCLFSLCTSLLVQHLWARAFRPFA